MAEMMIVLNRPRYESAMKPPSKGKIEETPTQVFLFLAASVSGSPSAFVRYNTKFELKPINANCSAASITTKFKMKIAWSSIRTTKTNLSSIKK